MKELIRKYRALQDWLAVRCLRRKANRIYTSTPTHRPPTLSAIAYGFLLGATVLLIAEVYADENRLAAVNSVVIAAK